MQRWVHDGFRFAQPILRSTTIYDLTLGRTTPSIAMAAKSFERIVLSRARSAAFGGQQTLDDVDGPTPTASECLSVVAGAPQGRDRPWSSLAESALIWARTSFTSTHWRANADRR